MKISIIIPAYNAEKFIEKCILSVLKQKYKNIEIIVVDDGSIDNTKKIILSLQKMDARIRYYYKKNGGVSSARNYGLTKANGDYISFLDADDYVEASYFDKIIECLSNDNYDVLIFNYYYVYNDRKKVGIISYDKDHYVENLFYEDGIMGYVFNKLYKSELIKSIRFDESVKIYEDLLYNVMVSNKVNKYAIIEDPIYYYLQNSESAMHTTFSSDFTRFVAYSKIINFMIKNKYSNDLISKIMYKYIWDYKRTSVKNEKIKKLIGENNIKEYFNFIKENGKIGFINKLKLLFICRYPKIYFIIKGDKR